ncbi:aminotransferase class I/II-fold pyridoxal phosphate-dependent enzyme [Pseudarthrobacter sp. MDT3-9]|nr:MULTISPECIES: aminotransferase class I/II-fold pyridoxal phosphate-dependent enzyme [unclassified Pseudarthrobacter]MCO4236394.1 aminotransferase class I/II-fold pyridoxal phosphate-dependent enzyme [Pseudarthrobacter sp. MDT3-28]MCO4253413.1 aminotransferase class I/II-fold pyridoxal phosphate-dependent enzyme [Pseudarthrobacter sp. MDT3-9]
MSRSMIQWLERQAAVRDRRGLVRRPLPRAADEQFIDLASNDYLGLAADPRVAEAAAAAASLWGAGATSSRLVGGTTRLHLDLEEELALLAGMEMALVFSSGYLANIGVITALGGPGTLIIADEHCHASMIDGFRLSRSRTESFTHNSVEDAGRLLAGRSEPRALIAVESLYSVLGDEAPLAALLALAEDHDAVLLIDEAHSLGVIGTGDFQGRGAVAGTFLAGHPNVVVTATLSKALGSQGGAVLGSALLREHLLNRARSFIFDTGLAPASAAAALAAVRIIRDEPWRAESVRSNAAALAAGLGPALAARGAVVEQTAADRAAVEQTAGAVQSIAMPSAASALAAAEAARTAGVRIGCFRPPSVPDGISRLRLTARATLTHEEIEDSCAVLRGILEELP